MKSNRPLRHHSKQVPAWHAAFLTMLPTITTNARIAFRHLDPEAREEAVAECIANAFVAYVRLVELGKASLAYPTPLAHYAIAQIHAGRKVGAKMNVRDVMSEYCQRRKNIEVERLDHYDREEDAWREVIVEDRHAGPADTARVRIDFGDWLRSLPTKVRRIAKTLATGERTDETARKFGLSAGRISQLRTELAASWRNFVGDEPLKEAALTAA